MKPSEFWDSTPDELNEYFDARIEWYKDNIRIENERVGLICATICNGVPVGFLDGKKHKRVKPSDFFANPKRENKFRNTEQEIYNTMTMWANATNGR